MPITVTANAHKWLAEGTYPGSVVSDQSAMTGFVGIEIIVEVGKWSRSLLLLLLTCNEWVGVKGTFLGVLSAVKGN